MHNEERRDCRGEKQDRDDHPRDEGHGHDEKRRGSCGCGGRGKHGERKPGPDGNPRPEYTGPRTTEEWLVHEWQQSYERACAEVRVDILKEKIRKTWGKSIEKIAGEVDRLMCKDWELSQKDGDHSADRKKLVEALTKKILEIYEKGPR